jgi:hypothetical protein
METTLDVTNENKLESQSQRTAKVWHNFPGCNGHYRLGALRAERIRDSMGGSNLFRRSHYLYKQYDFHKSNKGDLPWFNTSDDADWLGGQLYIDGDILLSAADAARINLPSDRP